MISAVISHLGSYCTMLVYSRFLLISVVKGLTLFLNFKYHPLFHGFCICWDVISLSSPLSFAICSLLLVLCIDLSWFFMNLKATLGCFIWAFWVLTRALLHQMDLLELDSLQVTNSDTMHPYLHLNFLNSLYNFYNGSYIVWNGFV